MDVDHPLLILRLARFRWSSQGLGTIMLAAHESDDDDDDEEDEDEDDNVAQQSRDRMQQLLSSTLQKAEDEDEDEDDEDDHNASGTCGASSSAVATRADPKGANDEADKQPAVLPSALDAFEDDGHAAFLRVEGPEFDASKGFRPPPLTAADLGPAVGRSSALRPATGDAEAPPPEQRFHADAYSRPSGGRVAGSVCVETDDERGRRVKYGAHAMLKADPWSDCNPNYTMRGKRKHGS